MDISLFFQPIRHQYDQFKPGQIGAGLNVFHAEGDFPEYHTSKVAILGVLEDRGSVENEGCGIGADRIREYLYQLYEHEITDEWVDLGNVRRGETKEDTYFAVQSIVEELIRKNVIPIIIGGGQDLTFAQYRGYENLEQLVNVVSVDRKFDMGDQDLNGVDSANYTTKMLLHQPNFLFNFTHLAHQSYFVGQSEIDLLDTLHFDSLRLGHIRSNIQRVEPFVRNADMVSFDVSAIKAADAPGSAHATPNGLLSDECCAITRYAGLSDKLSSIGFYEYNPLYDNYGQTAHLIAQMIWYFLEGVANRRNDIPSDGEQNYLRYRVSVNDVEEGIVFYKSLKTDRWWMNVPFPTKRGNRYKRHQLVPCDYDDYQIACNDEMPELWIRTYQKFM